MKNKTLKTTAAILASTLGISLSTTLPTFAVDDPCANTDIPEPVRQAAYNCNITTDPINDAGSAVGNILSTIIGALGIVAVIFIVMGGIQYLTSSGDAAKLKKARETILYACIGLAICALAFAITQFAINAINGPAPTPTPTPTPTS